MRSASNNHQEFTWKGASNKVPHLARYNSDPVGDKVVSMFNDDAIGSFNWWSQNKPGFLPESFMWLAVLEDAIVVYLEGPGHRRRQRRVFAEAKQWLFEGRPDDIRLPTYFAVCDAVNLNPFRLRSQILQEEVNRSNGHSRH